MLSKPSTEPGLDVVDNVETLKSKPNSYFERGKKLLVINNPTYVQQVQETKGAWDKSMAKCINQIVTVCEVDYDKFILVRTTENVQWLFNRSVLTSVDIHQQEKLFEAIERRDPNIEYYLTAENLNCKNREGRTPINLACCLGATNIVVTICNFEPDITIPDNFGKTALDNCKDLKHFEILQIISEKYTKNVPNFSLTSPKISDSPREKNSYPNGFDQSIKSNCLSLCDPPVTLMRSNDRKNRTLKVCENQDLLLSTLKLDNPPKDSIVSNLLSKFESTGLSKQDKEIEKEKLNDESKEKKFSGTEISSENTQEKYFLASPESNDSSSVSDESSETEIYSYEKSEKHFETPNECRDSSSLSEIIPSIQKSKKKVYCKKCFQKSVNYLTKCGHCYCASCFRSLETCLACRAFVSKNGLKIYI